MTCALCPFIYLLLFLVLLHPLVILILLLLILILLLLANESTFLNAIDKQLAVADNRLVGEGDVEIFISVSCLRNIH